MQIPVVVINLTRQTDRFEWFSAKAERAKLAIERLPAVDAKDPTNSAMIGRFRTQESSITVVETACFLSHRRAWEYALESSSDYLAVFEDDVHLSSDIAQLLDSEAIPKGLDLIKLEVPSGKVVYAQRCSATIRTRKLHRLLTRAYGSGAYIVSRRCARRLLELSTVCDQPVDVFLFDDFGPVYREFPILQIVPAPCIQDVNLHLSAPENNLFSSSIEEERNTRKDVKTSKKKGKRFKTLRRYLRNITLGENIFLERKRVPLDLDTPSAL